MISVIQPQQASLPQEQSQAVILPPALPQQQGGGVVSQPPVIIIPSSTPLPTAPLQLMSAGGSSNVSRPRQLRLAGSHASQPVQIFKDDNGATIKYDSGAPKVTVRKLE